jgi:hypothetical protein
MSKLAKALSAASGNSSASSLYVEDVFSTYLYTGTASAITVNNGIDLSGEGGLTWLKSRSLAEGHILVDTIHGAGTGLISSGTNALFTLTDGLTAFNSNGFTLGTSNIINTNASTNVSWTFRKAKKFFDVVTFSGNSVAGRAISHGVDGAVGMVIIKRTDSAGNWAVWNVGASTSSFFLNSTAAAYSAPQNMFGNGSSVVAPTSTAFTVGANSTVNASGGTYVAYLFASDAGGFGDDEDENIIKCGSYTGNGSATGPEIDLGFEPQFLLFKQADAIRNWTIFDVMRNFGGGDISSGLNPNDNGSEVSTANPSATPTATGFRITTANASINASGGTYIYMAIRRPMKTPESGTEVFNVTTSATSAAQAALTPVQYYSGFPVDLLLLGSEIVTYAGARYAHDRLTQGRMQTSATTAENYVGDMFDANEGYRPVTLSPSTNYYAYLFKRATGFMDVVVADAPGYAWTNQPHNLGVVPELLIYKSRAVAGTWYVMSSALASSNYYMGLNSTSAAALSGVSQYSATATTVSYPSTPTAGSLISYLFATLAGISKVGSYTGTAADLNVDCGFTAGARYILIKRTDSTGDWYVWDSLRGITAGNDPYLLLNVNAIQVTGTDYIDPLNAGFTVTSSAPAALNASSGTYIFLAIA